MPQLTDIEGAMHVWRRKGRMKRLGWNGKNAWVEGQFPDAHSKMTEPYLFYATDDSVRVPWTISQVDLFARDWVRCDEEDPNIPLTNSVLRDA